MELNTRNGKKVYNKDGGVRVWWNVSSVADMECFYFWTYIMDIKHKYIVHYILLLAMIIT